MDGCGSLLLPGKLGDALPSCLGPADDVAAMRR
jgi:hypothetical protein